MPRTYIEVNIRNMFMKHFITACLMANSGLGLRDRDGDPCEPGWCAYDATLADIEKEYSNKLDIVDAKSYLRKLYTICFMRSNCDHDDEFPF